MRNLLLIGIVAVIAVCWLTIPSYAAINPDKLTTTWGNVKKRIAR